MKKILLSAVIACSMLAPLSTQAQDLLPYKTKINTLFPEWKKQFPLVDVKDFEMVSTASLKNESQNCDMGDWSAYTSKFKDFLSFSTDKHYFIDIIGCGIDIEKKNGKYYAYADVDQGVILGNVKEKKTYSIAFCGASCRFEEVQWVDNNTAILIGNYYDENGKNVHTIALVEIDKNTITHYYNNNPKALSTKKYTGKLFKKLTYQ